MRQTFSKPLSLLLLGYVLLASLYSVVTPLFEASDEQWHYPMVKYLADHALALPVQKPGVETAWRQEGSQPPLYYMLGALLTFWIDTSDLDRVRKINPHADIGVIVPDGNTNMAIHDPALESFPWRGTALAVHLVRFLSVALSAVTVAMAHALARELFPGRKWLALAAAAFTAFNPMFLFISGSVNNDNLSTALASVLLVLIVRLFKRTGPPPLRDLILIGVCAGAGMLAKFNIGFLLPLVGLALAALAWRLRDWRPFLLGSVVTGGLTALISGWWYLRNWQLYGDPTGLNIFLQIVGVRPIPANGAQLWSERHTFLMSYWGFFGGVNVPLPGFMYSVFNSIAALAAMGLVVYVIGAWAGQVGTGHARPAPDNEVNPPILVGRAVTAIWIAVLFGSLLRWTSETWASQGRLMFAAISPLSLWMAVGLWQLGRGVPPVRWWLAAISVGWFFAAALVALLVLGSAYGNPYDSSDTLAGTLTVAYHEPGSDSPAILMADAHMLRPLPPVRVGEFLDFEVAFRRPEAGRFSRDWSVFIHLENDDGLIVAQRDVYLGQGRWATSLLNVVAPSLWKNQFAVRIPDYAYAPQCLKVYLGFYDLKTGERMVATGEGVNDNRAYVASVELLPRGSPLKVPNPMSVNFGGEAELVGYDVSRLVVEPGGALTVTFYWRALRPMSTDYRVFTQVLQPNTTNVFARSDGMPAGWSRPTSTWKPGEIIEDRHTLVINPDAPPGTWQLVMGMYRLDETPQGQQFRRLRIVTPDGGEAEDVLSLTRIKLNAAPK